MSRRLSSQQEELICRVDEVLFYIWDPIGVKDVPEARDEYENYASHVFSLLNRNAGESVISTFLLKTETATMGLSKSARAERHVQKVAKLLEEYRERLLDK